MSLDYDVDELAVIGVETSVMVVMGVVVVVLLVWVSGLAVIVMVI
jgi:hypothetical protein